MQKDFVQSLGSVKIIETGQDDSRLALWKRGTIPSFGVPLLESVRKMVLNTNRDEMTAPSRKGGYRTTVRSEPSLGPASAG